MTLILATLSYSNSPICFRSMWITASCQIKNMANNTTNGFRGLETSLFSTWACERIGLRGLRLRPFQSMQCEGWLLVKCSEMFTRIWWARSGWFEWFDNEVMLRWICDRSNFVRVVVITSKLGWFIFTLLRTVLHIWLDITPFVDE